MNDEVYLGMLALLFGYLTGSLSFARMVYYYVTREKKFSPFRKKIPGTDRYFDSNLVSATTVTLHLGKRYGLIVSMLDLLKVALPTLLVRHYFEGDHFFLLTAVAGIGGHVYPLYHRFIGGRGESPMIGAFLVINWFGILICNLISLVLGYLFGSVLVWRYGWYVVTIFWYAWYFSDPWYIVFAILVNFFFWYSFKNDLKQFHELKTKDNMTFSEAEVSEFLLMGRSPGKFLDEFGVPALIRKLLKRK